jgi:hypothetical protein
MKRISNLDESLNRKEMKMLVGGKLNFFCTCNGSNLETVVCSASNFQQTLGCTGIVAEFCKNHGYSGFTCNISGSY